MASAAEQLAANMSLSAFRGASDLKKRILFTLIALLVYRFGTYIPLPGIDSVALKGIFEQNQSGVIGMFDLFSGGAVGRMAIFALNIMPYITASIIFQLLSASVPHLVQLKKEGGEQGRQKINQYTRYATVLLAIVQSYGIVVGLERSEGLVLSPGALFEFTAVVTLVGGTVFLMWLGEQITARGIGNGISLIIFAGIVAELPSGFASMFELGRQGALSSFVILGFLLMIVVVIAFIVFVERAQRRLLVQYPKRQVGNKMTNGETSHLPLKLNVAGVIPPIFASSLLLLPTTIAGFGDGETVGWFSSLTALLGQGQPLYMLCYALGIVFFCFFYTSLVFNPTETADNIKRAGGFIPGFRPGEKTATHIDYVLTRLTVVGALYLTIVCLLPEFLIQRYSIPFYFGGTSLLIVVSVTMDTVSQIQGYLFSHQYENLIKKSQFGKGRGKS